MDLYDLFTNIPYLIKYSEHFFTLKMMLKYSLHTWKVAKKGLRMAFMMNKLEMINSCEIIIEKLKLNFFAKNHCEIQVRYFTCMRIILVKIHPSKIEAS